MTERENLLKRVQICGFALNDAALYLNTHPEDAQALAYYRRFLALHEAAAREYVERFGPIRRSDRVDGARWAWADGPWPWQTEEA